MCRLLAIHSPQPIVVTPYLAQFAGIAHASKAYQGHGWGLGYCLRGQSWAYYKTLTPIWDDDLRQFPPTTMLLAHVRSAFRHEGIVVENNMPFYDAETIFAFNGELQGVRIRAAGRIGAEKIFNVIKRFDHGDLGTALQKGTALIRQHTRYIRAMNIIMTDKKRFYVSSFYTEQPDYFHMVMRPGNPTVVCSEPLPGDTAWRKLLNDSFHVF
jgi:predicted glutamine amidotransferase